MKGGFTLIEVLAASLIASVVAGGTLMAFVTAARITGQRSNPASAEATMLAQETMERFRNQVAQDTTAFFTSRVGHWQDDPLLDDAGAPYNVGTESILAQGAVRRYCVTKVDCTGNGSALDPDDCYAVQVKVCWGDRPCPKAKAGASCP